MVYSAFFFSELLLVFKYFIPILLFHISYYKCSSDIVFKGFSLSVKVTLVATFFVFINIIMFRPSVVELMWGYSHQFRILGFTGLSLGLDGFDLVGNTSVAIGVLIAFQIIYCVVSLYSKFDIKIFFVTAILILSEMLVFSRSGIVVLLVALLAGVSLNIYKIKTLKYILFISTFLVFLVFFAFDINQVLNFGVIGKLNSYSDFSDASSNIRIGYWLKSINLLSTSVVTFIFGNGYGEILSDHLFDMANAESLFFTALYQTGILGFTFLVLFFLFLFNRMNYLKSIFTKNTFLHKITVTFTYFLPGYFIANVVGGNLLQTDFIMLPMFIILAVLESCYRSNNYEHIVKT